MYVYKAIIIKIVDGDTLDVDIDLGFHVRTRQRLRLSRIDTPERGEEGFTEATDRVKKLCPVGSEVIITSTKTGSFGRWLAEVKFNQNGQEINLGDQLLLEGLARVYGS